MSWLDNVVVGPPGPAGPAGPTGPTGATGEPAYTFVSAPFVQPTVLGFATIDVVSALWMATGAYLFIDTGGTYQVISIASSTQIVAMLVDAIAAPASTVAGGVLVSPSGVPGGGGGGGGSGIGAYASRPVPGTAGAQYFVTDGPISFVDDGTEWRPTLPGAGVGKQPPAIAAWGTQMGSGSASNSAGTLLCAFASNGSAHGVKGILYPLPAASNYTIIAGVQILMYPGVTPTDFAPVGCGWSDGLTGAATWVLSEIVQFNGTIYQSQEYYIGSTGGPNAISSIQNPYTLLLATGGIVFYKLVDDGTNRSVYVSGNRYDWLSVYQASRTAIITPTHFALGSNPYARPAVARLVHYSESTP